MRKRRQLKEGATYHVSSKINWEVHRFNPDEIKELFLEIIKRAKKKYKFSIKNFVIMGNHFHLMIKPGEKTSLSRVMQWIKSVFAMTYNKMHKLKGHLFAGRFWSKIIEHGRQFLDTFNYISLNPVKAMLSETAESYKYGGLYHIKNKRFDIVDKPDFDLF